MRVIAFPADRAGCGWYRIRWPAAALAMAGRDVQVWDKLRPGDGLPPVDVVVFQRPLRMIVVELIEWFQDNGVACVVEIDDALSPLPDGHPLAKAIVTYPNDNGETTVALEACCERADLVTVTTPALAAKYGAHGRVEILPNMIPRERILAGAEHRAKVLADEDRPTTLGYSGPSHFHAWDLPVVGKGVRQALEHTGAMFLGIGNVDLPSHFRLEPDYVLDAIHWLDMHDYGPTGFVAGQARFDVSVAPLLTCAFNDCKSDLKLLELAALGIPTVASPSAAYLDAAATVPGGIRIARKPYEWREHLVELLTEGVDDAGVAALTEWAWSRVLESNAHRWWSAWEKARDTRS